MNIIEKVWALLEHDIHKHQIGNKEQLKNSALAEWKSMPARLNAVTNHLNYLKEKSTLHEIKSDIKFCIFGFWFLNC